MNSARKIEEKAVLFCFNVKTSNVNCLLDGLGDFFVDIADRRNSLYFYQAKFRFLITGPSALKRIQGREKTSILKNVLDKNTKISLKRSPVLA